MFIFDGWYFLILYENLVKYLFEMVINVYNFFEMEVNVDMILCVEKLIMVKKICGELKIVKIMCIKFFNFSVDVDKWWGMILFYFVFVVDNVC